MTTVRELIERARENGYRELADTMDVMAKRSDPLDVSGAEQPIDGREALHFRTGIILAKEYVNEGTDDEKPKHREDFLKSLRSLGGRDLSDAFEFTWARRDELESSEFPYDELPIDDEMIFPYSVGIAFGIAHERS